MIGYEVQDDRLVGLSADGRSEPDVFVGRGDLNSRRAFDGRDHRKRTGPDEARTIYAA